MNEEMFAKPRDCFRRERKVIVNSKTGEEVICDYDICKLNLQTDSNKACTVEYKVCAKSSSSNLANHLIKKHSKDPLLKNLISKLIASEDSREVN